MSMQDEYQELQALVSQIEPDIRRCMGGQARAGTRVRHLLQQIKMQAQVMREHILRVRKPVRHRKETNDHGSE